MGIGVWMGEGPYNYAPYMGQSMKFIGQIPRHSPSHPGGGGGAYY